MANINLKIALAEPSAMIRNGLEYYLKKIVGFRIQTVEISLPDMLKDTVRMNKPDILIVNPVMIAGLTLADFKEETGCTGMRIVALVYTIYEQSLLRMFDEQITINDTADDIKHKLERLSARESRTSDETGDQQVLSAREKEIVVCVVKGMTNREIAESLFLSTHTVITHRRNIARKLQIHSASGLTIYAIVNKFVELSEIYPEKGG